MSDNETLKVYGDKAAEYADMLKDVVAKDPLLAAFIADIPKGGTVLDLGCGPGDFAAEMARAGLVVTAYDPVPEMVEMAAAHAGVTARQASFDDLNAENEYDGIWANFSLLHAAREDMPRHLTQIATALNPGGRFHIALKSGEGSKRDRVGRFYTYYTDSELTGLLEDAGFAVTYRATGSGKGLDGQEAPWICLSAHG
ncbi:MAG: class I SAM-dependent methyltransferase [Paracoccaceae bacterium]|nr:class I SAM-dependent methyltransferase [Paracoccaceae bacterium]